MSRVGRTTVLVVGGMLVIFVVAIAAMLDSIDRRFRPACLERVPEAPDGEFATVDWETDTDAGVHPVRYDDGLETTFPAPARGTRIVSTLPGITEMVADLGHAHRLVGISPWCDVPEGAQDPRRITVQPFDAEGMLAVRPDLVLLDRRLHLRDLATIRRRAPHVVMLETSRSLPHLVHSMQLLAEVLEGPASGPSPAAGSAHARALAFRARHEALVGSIDPTWEDGAPRVLVLGGWDPLYAMGPGSLLDDMLRTCGAINIACDLGTDASGTFNEELVLARRPGWILATTSAPMPDRMRERWRNVPAMRAGRVAPAHGDDVVRGGPRSLDVLARLHAVLRGTQPPKHLEATK